MLTAFDSIPARDRVIVALDCDAHTFTVCERCHEGEPTHTYHFGNYSITNLYNLFSTVVVARELGLSAEAIAASLERGINVTALRYTEKTVGGKRLGDGDALALPARKRQWVIFGEQVEVEVAQDDEPALLPVGSLHAEHHLVEHAFREELVARILHAHEAFSPARTLSQASPF